MSGPLCTPGMQYRLVSLLPNLWFVFLEDFALPFFSGHILSLTCFLRNCKISGKALEWFKVEQRSFQRVIFSHLFEVAPWWQMIVICKQFSILALTFTCVSKHHRGKKKALVLNDMFGKATISVMLLLQNLYYCAKRFETFRWQSPVIVFHSISKIKASSGLVLVVCCLFHRETKCVDRIPRPQKNASKRYFGPCWSCSDKRFWLKKDLVRTQLEH